MTTSRGKPLASWTDAEIEETSPANAPHIVYNMNDIIAERDRRESRKGREFAQRAAVASAVAAIASAFIAVVNLVRA